MRVWLGQIARAAPFVPSLRTAGDGPVELEKKSKCGMVAF